MFEPAEVQCQQAIEQACEFVLRISDYFEK